MKKLYTSLSLAAVLLLALATVVQAQDRVVTGKVTDENGTGMPGVNVLLKGTGTGTATDIDGNYKINVPGNDAVLVITFVGYASSETQVGAQTTINVSLKPDVQTLQELVVTGYVAEKKADIIGSVAVVDSKSLLSTPSANLSTQLQGRAAGVTVSSSGEPGAAARVRIRGFSSFGNSDPLYVIDGVPTEDASKLNPQDIESMQILKDATSASIYGSRAANGVIIITTKRGKAGTARISYDGYVGVQKVPNSTIPDMLNTQQYMDYLQRTNTSAVTNPVFGNLGSPTIPDYIVVNTADATSFKGGVSANDPQANPSSYTIADYSKIHQIMQTSPGTNWFKAVIQPGIIQSHQISASGGTDKGTYSLGFNYFNQEGVFKYTGYKRYTVRANTTFNVKDFLRVGENLQVSFEDRQGNDNKGEGGAWAQAYRMVPYIPVHDINGGFGGNGVGSSGNGSNPLANLYRSKDNLNNAYKIFGNVFGEVDLAKGLMFRSSFGVDYATTRAINYGYKTYERSENITTTSLIDQAFSTVSWTWTNTLTYNKTIGDHNIRLLAGTEAIKNQGSGIGVNTQNFDIEDPKLMNLGTAHFSTPRVYNQNMDPDGSSVDAIGGSAFDYFRNTLSSMFGRVDYQFKDRYLFNATVRRDGSSKFGSDNRYGVFPAVGAGWRISEESFMQGLTFISDLKLRGGWGQMGSQKNVPNPNAYTLYESNPSTSNYDITGSNSNLAVGFRKNRVGSNQTKWETAETVNIGFDASLLDGKWDIAFNWFNNKTKDLLIQRQRNGLEGLATQPFVNVGEMTNKGIDLVLTNRGNITSDLRYEANLTFTHYKNKVVKFDAGGKGSNIVNFDRLSQGLRTQAGDPISTFYGFQIDGFYNSEAEIANSPTQADAVVGSWKYKDVVPDGVIDDKDRTNIGSPHPKFQTGLNAALMYKNFDLTAFFFWNYGNKIYNYTKYYTDMRVFIGGVSTRVLDNAWTPENHNAELPVLAPGAANGYTSFTTTTSNSYYVETGSYLRLRNLQIGYTMPKSLSSRFKIDNLRIYVQGQNLFTVTKYSGPDPDISIQSGNGLDTYMGVDRSGFPNTRQYLVGLNITL